VIPKYLRNKSAAFFVDPPYTASGKSAGRRLYLHSSIDHDSLFDLLESATGEVMLTYDDAQGGARPRKCSWLLHQINSDEDDSSCSSVRAGNYQSAFPGNDLQRHIAVLRTTRWLSSQPRKATQAEQKAISSVAELILRSAQKIGILLSRILLARLSLGDRQPRLS
jgi:hypothetical protein